jgi:hypothetical protein
LLPGGRRHPSGERFADHLRIRADILQPHLQEARRAVSAGPGPAREGVKETHRRPFRGPDRKSGPNEARRAGRSWAQSTFKERADCLGRLRNLIVDEMDAIAALFKHALTGKPPVEAVMTEIIPAVENLRYLEKNLARSLALKSAPRPFPFVTVRLGWNGHPWGWVLILSPWNFRFNCRWSPWPQPWPRETP